MPRRAQYEEIFGSDPTVVLGEDYPQLVMSDPLNVAGEFSDGDDGRIPESVAPEMLGAFRTPLGLSERQKDDLVAFLEALDSIDGELAAARRAG